MKTRTTKLPDKPSALIRVALKDLAKCRRDPKYTIHMGTWHAPTIRKMKKVCAVCFGGAVMAGTLRLKPTKYLIPENFDTPIYGKLRALDYFRAGHVSLGLVLMDLNLPDHFPETVKVTHYDTSPDRFRRDMLKLARRLEGVGL